MSSLNTTDWCHMLLFLNMSLFAIAVAPPTGCVLSAPHVLFLIRCSFSTCSYRHQHTTNAFITSTPPRPAYSTWSQPCSTVPHSPHLRSGPNYGVGQSVYISLFPQRV
ncbi:hypothetical protein GQ44DRAFT_87581 [Phaeosphaeriaceae sp. PMI808]|nr:hypothetical protein GQ44DRAFT_87581 [Phaeosphaeriaceae sp. PMI808]